MNSIMEAWKSIRAQISRIFATQMYNFYTYTATM